MTLDEAYDFAYKQGYKTHDHQGVIVAFSALIDGTCVISIDRSVLCSAVEERELLAHELGHCETGSFYNRYSHLDVRRKHENRADRWAIKKLIPEDELKKAVGSGVVETWELAEYFSVTEPFMIKAILYYKEIK